MTRDIYIKTAVQVKRYTLGKNVRPLTIIEKRLYRTDERFMIASDASEHEFLMYDRDSTQPYWPPEMVSPDITMAYIDIAKRSGKNSAVTKMNWLNSAHGSWIIYGIVGCIVLYAVLTGGLV